MTTDKQLLIRGGRVYDGEVHQPAAAREWALPHLRDAHRRVWQADLGLQRFLARTRH